MRLRTALLGAVLGALLAPAYAFGPPPARLDDLARINAAGLRSVSEAYVLGEAQFFLETTSVSEFVRLYEDGPEPAGDRFAGLEGSSPAGEAFRVAKPLRVDAPFGPDTPMPADGPLAGALERLAERKLREWKIEASDPERDRWAEQIKRWYWQDALRQAGPQFLVPFVNQAGACVALFEYPAWWHEGGTSFSLAACPERGYLTRAAAQRLLERFGLGPAGPLRPLRGLGIPRGGVMPRTCYERAFALDPDKGVWTDGRYAVDLRYGTAYRVRPRFDPESAAEPPVAAPHYRRGDDPLRIVAPYALEPLFCTDAVPDAPLEPVAAPGEPPPLEGAVAWLPRQAEKLEAITGEDLLPWLRQLWGSSLTIQNLRDVVQGAENRARLDRYDPETPALDALEVYPLLRAGSLVHLPERPPERGLDRLLSVQAATSLQRLLARYGVELSLDQARAQVWTALRIQTGPEFYVPLRDPESGRCLALLAVPALRESENVGGGYALMECPSPAGPLDEEEARARLSELGASPAHRLELVRLPTRQDGRYRSCDALLFDGPFWSDGRWAVHAFSGHVYRILPRGKDWLRDPPPPYLQAADVVVDGEVETYLGALLPLRLEPQNCPPPAPPGPRPGGR
ncbi:hypothetical protein [Oceanithermus profundus]